MKRIILSTLACATLLLANNAPKYEISPMFGKANAHDRLNLENDKSIGATIAIRADESVFDQIELAWFNTSDVDFKVGAGSTNVNRLLLSGIKNYELSENSSLYALIGGGYEKMSNESNGVDSSLAANWGAGFKYAITKSISLKAEARQVFRDMKLRESSMLYHVGLAIPFGSDEKKSAPKEAKQTQKAAPVASNVNKTETNSIDMSKKVTSHYESDKAVINNADKSSIKKYVDYLKAFPKSKLVVEGHTDATASESHNRSLSARRAMNVKAYMVDLGVEASRIRVESYGETMPVVDNKTVQNRAQNRRTVLKVIR